MITDDQEIKLRCLAIVYPHQSMREAAIGVAVEKAKALYNFVKDEPSKQASTTPAKATGKQAA